MQSFAKTDNFSLYEGSIPDALTELGTECFDLVWADPPYLLSNNGTSVQSGKRVSVNKASWDRSRGTARQDYLFQESWISGVKRLLKWPHGSLMITGTYHSIYHCGHALLMDGWHIINDIVWFKPNGAPNIGCRCFSASHEILLWASLAKNARHKFNYSDMKNGDWHEKDILKHPGKQMRSVWSIPTAGKNEKTCGSYKTQKPISLLRRCIASCTDPGDLILDPFCGSGTTGIVAVSMGRRFVGIDNNPNALELALKRFNELERNGLTF